MLKYSALETETSAAGEFVTAQTGGQSETITRVLFRNAKHNKCVHRLARCGHETFGCDGDEDCHQGLECIGADTERRCLDIDECQDPR